MSRELEGLVQYQRQKYLTRNPISQWLITGFFRSLARSVALVGSEGAIRSVIEFGCGEGVSTRALKRILPGARLHGFDLHRPSVQIARHICDQAKVFVGDVCAAPMASDSADLVLMLEVLEHLPDPRAAIQEAMRVSRGWCIFSVPNEPLWRVLNMLRGAYWRDWGNTPGHINHWSANSFAELLMSQSLAIVYLCKPLPWLMAVCRI